MQSLKNTAASAKAGMEKNRASADENVGKKTIDPMEKTVAEQRKEEMKMGAEAEEHGEKKVHAAETGCHGTTTGGVTGHGTTTTGGVTGNKPTGGFGSSV